MNHKEDYTLPREERLKSRSTIDDLFKKGKSIFSFPIKLIFLPLEGEGDKYPNKFAVTIPKRLHKKAHIRNLLKRRIREVYRRNKPRLTGAENGTKRFALMYILVDKKVTEYSVIVRAMEKLNRSLVSEIRSLKT